MGEINHIAWLFGGAPVPPDFSCPLVYTGRERILCADGGLVLARRWGLTPEIVLGDFDTLKKIPDDIPAKAYPPEKDDTDMMLCAKHALSLGCTDLYIFGGLGGRLDHTLANFQLLAFLRDHDARGMLIGSRTVVLLQGLGTVRYPRRESYRYFSLFALSDCAVVTAQGVKYPLTGGKLSRRFPLGVSNEFAADFASVTVHSGELLVVYAGQ